MRLGTRTPILMTAALLLTTVTSFAATDVDVQKMIDEARFAEATEAARTLLTTAESAHGHNSLEAARAIDLLVQALNGAGKFREAETLELAQRAITIKEALLGPDDPALAESLSRLGTIHFNRGEFAASRPNLERALAIREHALPEGDPLIAASLSQLATLLSRLGETAQARTFFERAIPILQAAYGEEHQRYISAISNLAYLHTSRADYSRALPLRLRTLELLEKTRPDHSSVGMALNNLADLYLRMGSLHLCRPLLDRAIELQSRVLGPEHPDTGVARHTLAQFLNRIGDYAAAAIELQEVLRIKEKSNGPEHPSTAEAYGSIGKNAISRGDLPGARAAYERALAIHVKAFGPEHVDVGWDLLNLSFLLRRSGELDASERHAEEALAVFTKALGPNSFGASWAQLDLAHLKVMRWDFAGALPHQESGLRAREAAFGGMSPQAVIARTGLAAITGRLGRLEAAVNLSLQAERDARAHLRLVARSLGDEQALAYVAGLPLSLDVALSAISGDSSPELRQQVYEETVRSRAVILDEMATRQKILRGSSDPVLAAHLEELKTAGERLAWLLARGPAGQKPDEYRRLLDEARSERNSAERNVALVSAEFERDLSREQIGLASVRGALVAGEVLISYVRYDCLQMAPDSRDGLWKTVPSYHAFVLKPGAEAPVLVSLGPVAPIRESVSAWHQEASSGARSSMSATDPGEGEYWRAGDRLRQLIWDPIAPHVQDSDRILVVPDDAINLVNIAALPAPGASGRYLVESLPPLHCVSAERDLTTFTPRVTSSGTMLALGDPEFGSGEGSATHSVRGTCTALSALRFGRLPETAAETEAIATMWEKAGGAVMRLSGAAATEEAVRAHATSSRILHLATHGFFLEDECAPDLPSVRGVSIVADVALPRDESVGRQHRESPLLLSGLAFSGANARSKSTDAAGDGILTAEEVSTMDLSSIDLAVLSACRTGTGRILPGEGVAGLRRAFEIAGAGTLISSLWSVDDAATRDWMIALYEARLHRKLDTPASITAATLTVLEARRKRGVSTHPFYWGAFIAAGSHR